MNRRLLDRTGCRMGVAAMCWLLSPSAGAEETSSLFDLSLESLMELQVSVASPFESNVAGTAASVSVLRPSDWERRGARSVEEALEQIPSVAVYASLNSARMVAVRGYANEISVRGLATQLDGVPLNNFSYATSAYDLPFLSPTLLGGIEMIRGPGSTLYGSDAFHGVLSMTTGPLTGPGEAVQLQAGSYGDAVATVNAAGESGRFQAGAALTRHGDRSLHYDYHDPANGLPGHGERQNHEEDRAAYLHAGFGDRESPGGRLRINLFADDYQSRGFPGVGTQFYPPLARKMVLQSLSLAADRDTASQDSSFAMLGMSWQRLLGETLALEVDAWHWRAEQTWHFDFTAYPLAFPTKDSGVLPCRTALSEPNALPTFCPHDIYQGTRDHRTGVKVMLTEESRRAATVWAVGAGRDWMAVDDAFVRRTGPGGQAYVDITTPFADAGRRIDYLFLHARSLLGERLSAVYGARVDTYSDVGTATSPRLGLVWQGGINWSGKLLYNEAFRAPSAAERYGSGPGSQQMANLDIRPETIKTLELIWQHYRTGRDTEFTLFRSRWVDGIVLNPVTQTVSQYQNTGVNDAWGAEFGHSRLWRDWRLSGNLSHTRSRNSTTGVEYAAFPRYIANFSAGREWGDGWQFQLTQRVLLERTETDSLASLPVREAPGYWRTDLHLERRREAWRAWLDIRNLFDRDNITPSLYNAEGGIPDEGISVRVGGERRW
ncbi:MAG TPA: TonB-dependent receptor [Fluviicoccus sp.]|nr:TonB-dependent receptor [Fluviicoccus sp.]